MDALGHRAFSGTCDGLARRATPKRLSKSLGGARGQLRHGSEGNRIGSHWLSSAGSAKITKA
ncbi:hypothetical protein FOXYSP1_20389 [Fusarium oxysporum f. sp. phaseoli]